MTEPNSREPQPSRPAPPPPPGEREARMRSVGSVLWEMTPRLYVTWTLIAINVAVFVAMIASGVHVLNPHPADLLAWGANHGPRTLGGEWWRLGTSMFLHVGIIHLALNMFVLWQLGPITERLLGNVGFLVMYLLSGVAGSLASVYWNPDQAISAGASGAIFGVMGALLGFIVPQRRSLPRPMVSSIFSSGMTFIVLNVIIGLAVPMIDMSAHLGGLAAGCLCGLAQSHRLDPRAARGRWRRNAVVLVVGAAAVWAAIVFLPQAGRDSELDLDAEFNRVAAMERRVNRIFHRARERHVQGELSREEFAEVIEREVLP
ncbi:MAG: rhomboid family intramembrane serine protease, partial [Planctomycetaceae bacterium]